LFQPIPRLGNAEELLDAAPDGMITVDCDESSVGFCLPVMRRRTAVVGLFCDDDAVDCA